MSLHVHLLYHYREEVVDHLRKRLDPDIRVTVGDDLSALADNGRSVNIIVGGSATREQLTTPDDLRLFIVPWAGVPPQTRDLLREFPNLPLHNLHHNAAPTAEMAVTLLLSAARFVIPYDQTLRRADWSMRYARPGPSVLLAGKTALVLGYGAIGQRVARACHSLDMRVLAVRRHPTARSDAFAAEIHAVDNLHALLPHANAVIICLPHTADTDGLLGTRELALLPPKSVLVNIGRGPIVDEQALYAALRDGTLHAAGLDVWYNYPQDKEARSHTWPANYPFHELDNVVMSPHRGGDTQDTEWLRMEHLAQLLNAAARGEPLPNRVDLARGY